MNNARRDAEWLAFNSPVETPKEDDKVNHPSHYTEGRAFEVIEVLEDWCGRAPDPVLGGLQWNSLKYQGRLWDKANPLEDAKKSRWYLDRLIQKLEGKELAMDDAIPWEWTVDLEEIDLGEKARINEILSTVLFGTDEDHIPVSFAATHEDILEFEAWDPTLGPIEPEEPVKDLLSYPTMDIDEEPLGHWDQAAWDKWATRDDYKKREVVRCLDKHKIAYTSKQGGYIMGHQNNGDVRIIGTYGTEALGQKVEEPADNAPSEFEPEFDPFTDDQTAYDNFIFKFD